MTTLERTARTLYIRLAVSIAAIVVFVGLAVNAHFIQRASVSVIAIVPLALAVILLPRHTRAGLVAGADDADDPHNPLADRILRLGSLATTLRIVYLGVAVFCFFLMPYVVPDPS